MYQTGEAFCMYQTGEAFCSLEKKNDKVLNFRLHSVNKSDSIYTSPRDRAMQQQEILKNENFLLTSRLNRGNINELSLRQCCSLKIKQPSEQNQCFKKATEQFVEKKS